jgi:hypothetical protein
MDYRILLATFLNVRLFQKAEFVCPLEHHLLSLAVRPGVFGFGLAVKLVPCIGERLAEFILRFMRIKILHVWARLPENLTVR